MQSQNNREMTKSIAISAMLLALSMIFSYIEVLIPVDIAIPGVKLGLANLIVVSGIFYLKGRKVLLISIMRIILVALLFGNVMTLAYSLAGGILSFLVMLGLKQIKGFSVIGISVAGGVSHNIGQLLVAILILSSGKLLVYLPVLMISGLITGALIGIVAARVMKVLGIGRKAA